VTSPEIFPDDIAALRALVLDRRWRRQLFAVRLYVRRGEGRHKIPAIILC
jgi:hypothetical protein